MTEPTELLPCPFCGYSGPLDFRDGSTHRWGVAYCAECGASAGETRREYPDVGEWHAKAVAQWNTRAPQPTQAQAGAVPLTDEQIARIARSVLETPVADGVAPAWTLAVGIARAIEVAHGIGIKGGQHG